MKTIEEKAKEYAKCQYGSVYDEDPKYYDEWISVNEDFYREGFEAAQRWISVEDELPEETGWMHAPYIAKTKHELHIAGYTNGLWHAKGGLCIKEGMVTHWRYIEFK